VSACPPQDVAWRRGGRATATPCAPSSRLRQPRRRLSSPLGCGSTADLSLDGVRRALPCSCIGLLGVRVGRTPNPQGARPDERGWDLQLVTRTVADPAPERWRARRPPPPLPKRSSFRSPVPQVPPYLTGRLNWVDQSAKRRRSRPTNGSPPHRFELPRPWPNERLGAPNPSHPDRGWPITVNQMAGGWHDAFQPVSVRGLHPSGGASCRTMREVFEHAVLLTPLTDGRASVVHRRTVPAPGPSRTHRGNPACDIGCRPVSGRSNPSYGER